MEKHDTVERLVSQYNATGGQKIIALTYGDGIDVIPEDVAYRRVRYARLGRAGRSEDLSDLLSADLAIIDLHEYCDSNMEALRTLLTRAQHDQDYLVITEATRKLPSDIVAILEGFRPRLIVTSARLERCA